MTPKQKAQELVNKYSNQLEHIARIADEWSMSEFSQFRQIIAAKCALIAADEAINMFSGVHKKLIEIDMLEGNVEQTATYKFWQEVKQEIEKL